MLDKKAIENFNKRINRYGINTTEKEIEVEFYCLMKEFYRNYDKFDVSYTAPHQIDGLIEVNCGIKTYKVLIEAKSMKNYTNKESIDKTLSQALYYCKRLKMLGNILPAFIILLERRGLVLLEIDQFESLIDEISFNIAPSSAAINDLKLMDELLNFNYNYIHYTFNNSFDYNAIFSEIHIQSLNSRFFSIKAGEELSDQLCNDFVERTKVLKHDNNFYIFSNDLWQKLDSLAISFLLDKFFTEYSHYPKDNILQNRNFEIRLKEKAIESEKYFRINNGFIDNKGIYSNTDVTDSLYLNRADIEYIKNYKDDCIFFPIWNLINPYKNFSKQDKSTILIECSDYTQDNIVELLNKFKVSFSYDIYSNNLSGNLIFTRKINDKMSVKIKANKDLKVIRIAEDFTINELFTLACNSALLEQNYEDNNNYEIKNLSNNKSYLNNFFENNLDLSPDYFVLLSDLYDLYESECFKKGEYCMSKVKFVQEFKCLPFILDNSNVFYKTNSRITKKMKYSSFNENKIHEGKNNGNFILGARFK